MPLFHIHGLMAALLASLSAGASVVCTDGVYAAGFYAWLRQFRPTWYTAVPTMHQAILARAREHADVIADVPLRLVRSSSAALPERVLAALEETFRAPVLEAYGMTEAAHQMASNPLPPRNRQPGSVGLPAGPDIAVMAPDGRILSSGETGEIVIRGENVTDGYEDNPAANAEAFRDGWFRTGDQGWIDADGYLRLTGRLKELINRGGEKISPREVDEVLLAHPAVRQAVCFAVAHAQLGEEIGAAVEVRDNASVTVSELRSWVGERLPAFKVPRVIRFLDEIPKGPTGKLQRVGLAARLGIEPLDDRLDDVEHVPARSAAEKDIAEVWAGMFPGQPIGVRTRFEALGGDSLLAVRMLAEVSERLGRDVPYLVFAEDGTIEALAAALDAAPGDATSPLVALRAERREAAALLHPGSRRRVARHRSAQPRAAAHPAGVGVRPSTARAHRQRRASRQPLRGPAVGARSGRPVSSRWPVLRRRRRHRACATAHRAGQTDCVSRPGRRAQSRLAPFIHPRRGRPRAGRATGGEVQISRRGVAGDGCLRARLDISRSAGSRSSAGPASCLERRSAVARSHPTISGWRPATCPSQSPRVR